MKNKNKYFKIISSTIIASAFLFLAFGSDESKDKGSSNSSTTSSSSSIVNEAPVGYHKGSSCIDCSRTGYYTHDVMGLPGSKGGVCAGCNGKGYHWVRD